MSNEKDITLLVLAAGMGSRYGSLKQMDGIGPNKEAILDYSVYDAIRAGFNKVVFVIRKNFENDFKGVFNEGRFNNKIKVEYVFQELDKLPSGFSVPEGREKPWGTNHAVLMAKEAINEPFAIINADDFYGMDAFKQIAKQLRNMQAKEYCLVGYQLKNTLSENGTVSRGVCQIDAQSYIQSIEEHTQIQREQDAIYGLNAAGQKVALADNTIVSMNFLGFTPDYFQYSEQLFIEFLKKDGSQLKSEFYIPSAVNALVSSKEVRMKVIESDSEWFGVTYKEDREDVQKRLSNLICQSIYPENLWG